METEKIEEFELVEIKKRSFKRSMSIEEIASIVGMPANCKDYVIAGGALVDAYNGRPPKDFDFYFFSIAAREKFLGHLRESREVKVSLGKILNEKQGRYSLKITFSSGAVIDVIEEPRDDARAVLLSFDFRLCGVGYNGSEFVALPYAETDLQERKIVCTGNPRTSLYRLVKYIEKGFTIGRSERAKLNDILRAGPNHDEPQDGYCESM